MRVQVQVPTKVWERVLVRAQTWLVRMWLVGVRTQELVMVRVPELVLVLVRVQELVAVQVQELLVVRV